MSEVVDLAAFRRSRQPPKERYRQIVQYPDRHAPYALMKSSGLIHHIVGVRLRWWPSSHLHATKLGYPYRPQLEVAPVCGNPRTRAPHRWPKSVRALVSEAGLARALEEGGRLCDRCDRVAAIEARFGGTR